MALAFWLELRTLPLHSARASSISCLFSMPVAVLTAPEQTEAINTLDSSLSTILQEKRVRRDVQAALAKLEIQALMEGTIEKFREWLHSADIGLARVGPDKVQAAKVVAAWEAAVERTSTQRQLDAEQRTAGLPAAIPGGDVRDHAASMGSEPWTRPDTQSGRATREVVPSVAQRSSGRR